MQKIKNLLYRRRVVAILTLLLLLVVQWIVFGSHVGSGFVTDDFNWLDSVVRDGKVDYLRPFTATTGFFRPLVGVSFALQFTFHGLDAQWYGWFNLLLHMLNIILVYLLLSNLTQTQSLALPVTVLFALNAKATEMAVRWISGRTSLLCAFFMLLSLYLLVKDNPNTGKTIRYARYFLVGLFYLAALLAKETAVAVPIFIFLFTSLFDPNSHGFLHVPIKERVKKGGWSVLPFLFPLVLYVVLRFNSDAMTPFNAPPYYQLSFTPGLMVKNIMEYILRAGMLDIYILALLFIVGWIWGIKKNYREIWFDRVIIVVGGIWFISFLLPILGLSARSDLYVYFPQIGLHVIVLVLISRHVDFTTLFKRKECNGAEAPNIKQNPQRYVVIFSVVLLFVIWTGYLRIRAEAASKSPRFTTFFTQQLVAQTGGLKTGSRIWLLDMQAEEKESPTRCIANGFTAMLNLYYPQKGFTGEIIPVTRLAEWEDKKSSENIRFRWQDNRLIRYDRNKK